MEFAIQYFPPAVMLTLAGAIIGVIVKVTRLIVRVERTESSMVEVVADLKELRRALVDHTDRDEVHFDKRLAAEIEGRQNDRFSRIEGDLTEIKTMVKELTRR